MKNKDVKIVAIGATGSGKSALLNLLSQDDNNPFQSSGGAKSATQETKTLRFADLLLVDTPGIGSSYGSDTRNISKMVLELQSLQEVHLFLLVINGEDPRISQDLQSMIDIFLACFGQHFLWNAAFVFTHWPRDKKAVLRRELQGTDEEKHGAAFNNFFNEKSGQDVTMPCFFIDSVDWMLDPCLYEETLVDIKDFAQSLQAEPFVCHGIKDVLGEKDQLHAAALAAQQATELADRRVQNELHARLVAEKEAAAAKIRAEKEAAAKCRAEEEAAASKLHAQQETEARRLAEVQADTARRHAGEESEAARARIAAAEKRVYEEETARRRAQQQAEEALSEEQAANRNAQGEAESANRQLEHARRQIEESERARVDAEGSWIHRMFSRTNRNERYDEPVVEIIHAASGMALHIEGGRTESRSNIELYERNGSPAQKWVIKRSGVILNPKSGKVLDVYNGGTWNRTNIWLFEINGTAAQQWVITLDGQIVNPKSGKALDVSHGHACNGQNIWLYALNGTPAQKWEIVLAD